MPNRLASETSPYLQQHAHNPVDWYPWGPEAFERAESEGRPILLSVGYSSCHWCHVMERESFDDPSIAELMNELFVNIKVDREERPDVDQIYMRAIQAMSGRGGWPMTVFLTPDRLPFFGGTYYPPEPRPGIPAFPDVLRAIDDAWRNRREEVRAGSTRLLDALREASAPRTRTQTASLALVDTAVQMLGRRYDATHGGFGPAPKFPQPVTLEVLLRHHARTSDPSSLSMAVHTLRRMAAGGMRDHLGGGFHRYSVDERWLVPHFEKMLYDNALLARVFLDAWKLTGSDDLATVVVEVLDDLANDFSDPRGGFYAARDADSEGVEGRFYVWSPDEVTEVLGDDAPLFCRAYDVSAGGNFEGSSILHLPHPVEAVAASEQRSVSELDRVLARGRAALLERRAGRVEPFRDEKVIVSWNAFAIRAFAEAGAALGRADYVERAVRAAEFIWEHLRTDGQLLHTWIEGHPSGRGFLDDYAALGNALLSLHSATLDTRWLERALMLGDEALERFYDNESGTVFDTSHDAETLVLRPRDPMDGATPSGASLAAELFARAGALTHASRYRNAAQSILDHEVEAMQQFGPAFGRMLSVVDRLEATSVEVALVVPDDSDPSALIQAAHSEFLRGSVIAGSIDAANRTVGDQIPLLHDRPPLQGRPTAYVCENHACDLPETEPAAIRARLAKSNS
ncbi:MAG: thioredoxin domain-containing protein [Longimicrobiales bacterium]